MTCRDLREYLYAFLDDELDAALSLEVQRHLERCADCTAEAERERAMRKRLVTALDVGLDEAEAALHVRLANAPFAGAVAPSRRRFAGLAAAAALLLAVMAGALYGWLSPAFAGRLTAEALVADFEGFLAKGAPLGVRSDRADLVERWIRDQMHLEARLPTMRGRCILVGARRCALAGRPVAFALYDVEGRPASLLVFAGDPGTLARATASPTDHAFDRYRDHAVVSRRDGELTYAAVGRLSEAELLDLLPPARTPR